MSKEKDLAKLVAEAESDTVKALQEDNRRLLKQNEKLKMTREEYCNVLEEVVLQNIRSLDIPPCTVPPHSKKRVGEEICVPIISDIQLAKRTATYDTDTAEKRVDEYANKIIKLARLHRASGTPVKKAAVLALGDIVEGELIFPGQQHEIDASLYRQVTVDGPRIMHNFLSKLLSEFETVDVYWVIGNHGSLGGRARRDYSPETNADRMLGKILETMFEKEKRINFVIPEGGTAKNWYTVADLGEKAKFLCFHGDNIRGSMGLPFYGYNKKILGWKALASAGLMEDFTHAVCGHYHTPTSLYLNDVRLWVNGSTESHNAYAQEQLAAMGRPSQYTLFVKPDKGVTAEYLVSLE
tara:strand:- start:815 stop:1873 length:1059 start_codon:yes stop_codon:yes gene_type:complete